MSPNEFISQIFPAACESAKHTNIPASFTIAEAALESGWGSSMLAKHGFNLFGVKADPAWHGGIISMRTREFVGGQWIMVNSNWRAYPDWYSSIQDHSSFLLTNRRYQEAFKHRDGCEFANEVARAGYATDPDYAKKIVSIIRSHGLDRFDP